MKFTKHLYYRAVERLPLTLLKKTAPGASLFPYHHIVSDHEVPHIKGLYGYKNRQQFRDDLEYLLKYFDPISPDDLLCYVDAYQKLPAGKFLLSFDDGFREVKEVVAPILRQKGVPAVCFINPAFIDNREMCYRNKLSLILHTLKKKNEPTLWSQCGQLLGHPEISPARMVQIITAIRNPKNNFIERLAQLMGISFSDYLAQQRPWLTSAELRSLQADGIAIGAHSWDHPYYDGLSVQEQLDQTIRSCSFVQELTGKKKILFSFPHSDKAVKQSFYQYLKELPSAPQLLFGVQNNKPELENRTIHRFNAERPEWNMAHLAKGLFVYMLWQKITHQQNIQRIYA